MWKARARFPGQKAYSRKEAMEHFRRAAAAATKPFIYLSAGVSNDEFTESLELAAEAGVKFQACSADAPPGKTVFPSTPSKDARLFEQWMRDQGVKNIKNVNERLKAATPWYEIYGVAAEALVGA